MALLLYLRRRAIIWCNIPGESDVFLGRGARKQGREGAGAMADQGHKTILDRGTAVWNKWRQENPGVRPDLSHSNIRIKQLEGVNLKGVCLRGAMLPGADLRGANLEDADLAGADLMEADLRGAWIGRSRSYEAPT